MKILYPLFLENIKRNHLIENHDTVILGFSGGKDSVTLFYLLEELKKDIGYAFFYDPAVDSYKLSISANSIGDVTISGTVNSFAEKHIAEKLGLKVGTVKSRKSRGREYLKRLLEGGKL